MLNDPAQAAVISASNGEFITARDKIVSAAAEQLHAIRRIEETTGLEDLPEKLYETALLRIANPEASLTDLAALAIPLVSKSCMGHRIKKLMELAGC